MMLEQAEQKVALFERQFGEAYRLLAYHAALPLVLTPELVHYLRTEFLLSEAEQIPWEAEADLLLSDLCSQVGYELYVMDTAVRSYLLEQMQRDNRIPVDRMQSVAQVLISYVTYLSQINPGQRQRELQAQRWAAMGYLGDEQCQQMAREIAEQFEMSVGHGDATAVKAEFARLAQIAKELKPLEQASPELVEFAKRVGQSIRAPQTLTIEEQRQSFRVGDRVLRLPDEIVATSEELPGLQLFEFDVVEFVEVEEESSGGLQRVPYEFEVATIEFPRHVSPSTQTRLTTAGAELLEAAIKKRKLGVLALAKETAMARETIKKIRDRIQPVRLNTIQKLFHFLQLELEDSHYEYYTTDPMVGMAMLRQTQGKPHFIIQRRGRRGWQHIEYLSEAVSLEFVNIPAGSFLMGAPENELESYEDERPQHTVSVPEFYMGKYPVTQAQWKFVSGLPQVERSLEADPSHFKGDDRPVEQVSWLDAMEFCARLSQHTEREYRLPSEAEWEYACRAGTTAPFHFGETIDAQVANYQAQDEKIGDTIYPGKYGRGRFGEYRKQTTPVGSFQVANSFGLHDMHGNVLEWCLDHWHENYENAPTDGSAWLDLNAPENAERLLRGGSWYNDPRYCRSACRSGDVASLRDNDVGFRLVSPARTLPLSLSNTDAYQEELDYRKQTLDTREIAVVTETIRPQSFGQVEFLETW